MKLFVLLFGLLFSINSFAANGSGNVSNVLGLGTIGASTSNISSLGYASESNVSSTTSTYSAGYFEISTSNQPTFSSGNVAAMYRNGVQYVVSAGRMAICVNYTASYQAANLLMQIVSSPSSFAHNTATGSMPAGTLYQGGIAGAYTMVANTAAASFSKGIFYVFSDGHYPGVQIGQASATGAAAVSMTCKEI